MVQLLISLVVAHIVGDFWLQPDWMAARKREPGILVLHVLIHALLAWVFAGQFGNWMIPVVVFVAHLVLDVGKLFLKDTVRIFLSDQILHLLSLLGIAWLMTHVSTVKPLPVGVLQVQIWLGGAILSVYGAGILLGKCIAELFAKNEGLGDLVKQEGLKNGGRMIGQLERALIFLLVMFGHPSGIGFLVAAKSVLRFGEVKDNQKLAEYVLIGTFLSFGIAIAIACFTKWLLANPLL